MSVCVYVRVCKRVCVLRIRTKQVSLVRVAAGAAVTVASIAGLFAFEWHAFRLNHHQIRLNTFECDCVCRSFMGVCVCVCVVVSLGQCACQRIDSFRLSF